MRDRRDARTSWEPPSAGGERSPWLAMRRGGDSVRTALLVPDRCGFSFEGSLWNLVDSGRRGWFGDGGFGLSVYIRAVARRGRAGPISGRGQVSLAVSSISLSLSKKKNISLSCLKNILCRLLKKEYFSLENTVVRQTLFYSQKNPLFS